MVKQRVKTAMILIAVVIAILLLSDMSWVMPLVAAILACMVTDTAAFFVGRACGKHKLAPKLSPSKTIEGAIGGIACTTILNVIVSAIFDAVSYYSVDYGMLLLWVLPATVIAQFGDLSLSVIKRIVGVKDFGDLLPGHGGILDRSDSYLFVIPYTHLFISYIGGFIG